MALFQTLRFSQREEEGQMRKSTNPKRLEEHGSAEPGWWEAWHGKVHVIDLVYRSACPNCFGLGFTGATRRKCRQCWGYGSIPRLPEVLRRYGHVFANTPAVKSLEEAKKRIAKLTEKDFREGS